MDLANVGAEIIYCEITKTVTLYYENHLIMLQRAPTPILNENIIEEDVEDEDMQLSQNI